MEKANDNQRDEKNKKQAMKNAVISGSQTEVVQRYGSAAKEQFVAYSGVNRETGQVLKKGLKDIANSRVNPDYASQNIKQQAGFSAEVKTVARENAEKIIAGDKTRSIRTDDYPKSTRADGTLVGGTNDQLFDIVSINEDGSYIEGSARQLKYVGKDAKSCCEKLLGKKFDKYREADATIEIPKDSYDGVVKELDGKISTLNKQIKSAEQSGNAELAQRYRTHLKKTEKTKANLKKGKLTNEEAIQARVNPEWSTAKDVVNYSHRAGFESAKSGAVIGGGISLIHNIVAVVKGEKDPEDAALSVAGDTVSAAGLSYATSFIGSAIKGGLQNAQSTYLSALSSTAAPAMIATAILETGKTLYRFVDGQIDGAECLLELGERGTGIVASTIGATVGQALIPVPVLGGLIGSMIGYALSSMYYNALTSALNEAKFAHAERLRIEAECEASIASIREYRIQMEITIRNYLSDHICAFNNAFSKMQEAFHTRNVDLIVEGANDITKMLGGEVLFQNINELDMLMENGREIII